MNFKTYMFGILSLIAFSCKSDLKKQNDKADPPKIEISTVLEDSISIRALDYKNEKYWFAGSNGQYGYINSLNDSVTLFQIEIENNLEFRSIAVTSNYTYILTAGNPALLYKISQENDSTNLVYTERGDSVLFDSMKFWNDDEGIAMGDPQNGCFSIIKTYDAGKSWQKVECENMPKALDGEAAFAASNSNLNMVKNQVWFVTGGKHPRIFHSKDKSLSWKAYDTPITSGGQMTGIYATDFYDKDLGVIIGGDWNNKDVNTKNKALTFDSGKTWQLISEASGPGYCSDVIFIPETQGQELLAVGTPGLWWSGNQGKNWTKLSNEGFYTVNMINATDGYLAGKHKISKFSLN